jgi:CheY-specific phosphatase CheX
MREDQVRHFIEANLSKIVLGCAGAVYQAPLKGETIACKEFCLDSPIVGHQLVCTDGAQILCFIVMELNSFLAMGGKMFPGMQRNESVKMLVSANSEILNTISSKLASILAKSEGKGAAVITPPVVMNYSGDQKMALHCADSIFLDCKSQDFGFRFIATFQMI